MITQNCKKCDKEFRTYASRIESGRGIYCSHTCANATTSIGNKRAVGNRSWVGKKHTESSKQKNRVAHMGKRMSPKTEFKKGMTPWNFGLPSPWLLERNRVNNPTKKGNQSHLWKGGVTPVNAAIRNSTVYKKWREAVFMRDDFTCQHCHVRGGLLHADHIQPFALFPELRFEISNGRTLCISCHKKTPTYGNGALYKKQCVAVA